MTTALPEWFYPGPSGGWTADTNGASHRRNTWS